MFHILLLTRNERCQGVQDGPVDGTCHQGGGGVGGGGHEQRVGDDGGAVKPCKRPVRWVVPRRRRGIVPKKVGKVSKL